MIVSVVVLKCYVVVSLMNHLIQLQYDLGELSKLKGRRTLSVRVSDGLISKYYDHDMSC